MPHPQTIRYLSRATARIRGLLPGRDDLAGMRTSPREDVLAGLTVAVAALPLSLGLGIASGLGARAGLVSAVVAGGLAALLGGSKLQITGPTGLLAVALLPVARAHGAPGVLTTGLLAGLALMAAAHLGLSRYVRLVPVPVVTGFVTGSAGVLLCQQLPTATGSRAAEGEGVVVPAVRALGDLAPDRHGAAAAMTVGVLALCLAGSRLRPALPVPLMAVALATVLTHFLHLPLATIGPLPAGLPAPSLGFVSPALVPQLLPSVFAVVALSALEALRTAAAADSLTDSERHDGDRVLFGLAAANAITPVFGGMAATGTVCRTGINIRAGALSRLAALVNAAALALVALTAGPLMSAVPLAAIAGVLVATAVRMVDLAALRALRGSGHGQLAVAAVTATTTVLFDLVTGITVGAVLTAALALHAVTKSAAVHRMLPRQSRDGEAPPPAPDDASVAVYRIDGPLLFTTADRLLKPVSRSQATVTILHMARVTLIDATGVLALGEAIDNHHRRRAHILLSGIRPNHRPHLDALGVLRRLRSHEHHAFPAPADAFRYAQRALLNPPALPGPAPTGSWLETGDTMSG
ncbi:SulP family inorganic anion transporter [Streptomyces sp. NPDC020667]|uniref:SulP family inorganic anion transporter n=1 Tax=Streptomyces sp. NPDC020667 TaxID=3154895 RepID=UPI0033DF15F1